MEVLPSTKPGATQATVQLTDEQGIFGALPLAVLLQQMIEGLNGQRCQYGLMLSTAGSQHASSLISCLEKRCCACSIENAGLRQVRERRLHVIGALLRSQHSC
jgi:hypothetical protein